MDLCNMAFPKSRRPIWLHRIPEGSLRLPRAEKACANFLVFGRADRSPLPFVFHVEEIHKPGHQECFPDRLHSCTYSREAPRLLPPDILSPPRHPVTSLSLDLALVRAMQGSLGRSSIAATLASVCRCHLGISPTPPRHPTTSLLLSLALVRVTRGSLGHSSTAATSLIHHHCLVPCLPSPSPSPRPSVSKVSAPHLLCCISFSVR